jgi:hypothetical protein
MIGFSSNPSKEECFKHVLEKEPTANGMQYGIPNGRCWAEFDMTSIGSSENFKSCYFPDNLKECKKVEPCSDGCETCTNPGQINENCSKCVNGLDLVSTE